MLKDILNTEINRRYLAMKRRNSVNCIIKFFGYNFIGRIHQTMFQKNDLLSSPKHIFPRISSREFRIMFSDTLIIYIYMGKWEERKKKGKCRGNMEYMNTCSQRGVLKTLLLPNRSANPVVQRKTPPKLTSSPNT